MIEDHGFEAVPVYPGVPERPGIRKPLAPDRPPPEININVRIAGVACGVGEIGWSKVFLTKKFGPRVRLGTILTDAELEPDPLLPPGTLCNRCMACVPKCPGGAIPKPSEREPIRIKIEDTEYEWGDVHMGRCTLTHHGLNRKASPFLAQAYPGYDLDVPTSNMSEEAAYKMTYPLALAKWGRSPEFPDQSGAAIPYYNQIISHTGYFAICGAKGCIRACAQAMEKRGAVEQDNFKCKIFERPDWELPEPQEEETGGIAEGKFPEEFNNPDPAAGKFGEAL